MTHRSYSELEAGLDHVRAAPKDRGVLAMIVRRPQIGARDVLDEAELNVVEGLAGDSWRHRRSTRTTDGSPHPDMQLNIIGARAVHLVAQDRSRWPLAGDQLVIDLDLSGANLPPGTRLAIGSAVIEVTEQPHTGCGKFVERFGVDAHKLVNSPVGRELNLRGINAKVVQPGTIRVGDPVVKHA
jgi:MOSC domain